MKHTLQYIFQDKAQEILDVFTDLFNIRIAFFSASGKELKVGNSKPLCDYCHILRGKMDYEPVCLALDQKMRKIASETKKTTLYDCHAGMTEAITPIYMEDELIGYLMIGQFRTTNEPIKTKILKKCNQNTTTNELTNAYNKAVYHSKTQTERILKLFEILVDYILQMHMIELYGDNSIQPLVRFMETNMQENLNLSDGANLLMQSQSSLSQKFKKITGNSFKQYQINLKLDRADELFKKRPGMTIREVALKLGYEDPYYFSRLYKKHRGCSPSETKQKFQ